MVKYNAPLSPRSPVGSVSDDELSKSTIVNVVLEDREDYEEQGLKQTVILPRKMDFTIPAMTEEEPEEPEEQLEEPQEPQEEQLEEPQEEPEEQLEEPEESEEEPEEPEEEDEEEPEEEHEEEPEEPEEQSFELDNNTKNFIVLCTHKYLYGEEVPAFTSNVRRQKGMEKIIQRHVDSICEAFKYIS